MADYYKGADDAAKGIEYMAGNSDEYYRGYEDQVKFRFWMEGLGND